MHVIRRKGWEISEREATPEAVFFDRRTIVRGGAICAAGAILTSMPRSARADGEDPSVGLYPAKRNEKYTVDRPITPEEVNAHYNNFYEFGESKNIYSAAQALKTRPWQIKIDGMVETPREIAVDDLLKLMPLEERLYRHRCVEAWSMTIPWTGFPLSELVDYRKAARLGQISALRDLPRSEDMRAGPKVESGIRGPMSKG